MDKACKKGNRIKMKLRKISCYLLSCVFALCLFSVNTIKAKAEYFTSGYYTYYVIEGEGACITECEASVESYVSIPASLGGYPVTRLGPGLFYDFDNITSVSIPGSVYWIQGYCFYDCDNLTTVNIPQTLTHIEGLAFAGCEKLKEFDMPSEVMMIGQEAFDKCSSLKEVSLPQTLTHLGSYAFRGCNSITTVTIPSSAETSLGVGVFEDCTGLKKAKIENGITKIPAEMFANCSALETVWLPNSVIDIRNSSFSNCYLLENIYFCGTENEWESVSLQTDNIHDGNTYVIKNASLNYHQFGDWSFIKEYDGASRIEEHRFCKVCGEEETRIITSDGHIYNSVATPPTCLEDGYTTHTCQKCGDSYIDSPTLALGHSFSDWIERTPATCTENGEDYRVCSGCGKEEIRTITALGHDFDTKYTIDKYPTENENGSKSKHCKRCEEITGVTTIRSGRITEYRYRDKTEKISGNILQSPWVLISKSYELELVQKYTRLCDEDLQKLFDKYAGDEYYTNHTFTGYIWTYSFEPGGDINYTSSSSTTHRYDENDNAYIVNSAGRKLYYLGTKKVYDFTVYKYVYEYHYYRWTEWSDWSREQVSATDNRMVETKIRYTDITLANEEVNSLRLGLLSETTDESMDCNNDGIVDLLDLVLMHNAREDVKTVSGTNNSEPQNEPVEQSAQAPETAYYDDKMKQIA